MALGPWGPALGSKAPAVSLSRLGLLRDDADPLKAWAPNAFLPPRPFKHPQLGEILIGNDYRKLAKRNPHPRRVLEQADRNWLWLRQELRQAALRRVRCLPASSSARPGPTSAA